MTDTLKLQFKNRDFSEEILLVKKKMVLPLLERPSPRSAPQYSAGVPEIHKKNPLLL